MWRKFRFFLLLLKQKFKCHENPKIKILRKFEVANYLKDKKRPSKNALTCTKIFQFFTTTRKKYQKCKQKWDMESAKKWPLSYFIETNKGKLFSKNLKVAGIECCDKSETKYRGKVLQITRFLLQQFIPMKLSSCGIFLFKLYIA